MLKDLDHYPRLTGVRRESFDLDMPFETLGRHFASDKGTVLLLSGSESDAARYHIIGIDPWLTVTSRQGRVRIQGFGHDTVYREDPFTAIDALIRRFFLAEEVSFDLPVQAGFFGYLSYDLKDRIEKLPVTCMDTHLPDLCLFAPSVILLHDKKTARSDLLIPEFENDPSGAADQKCRSFFNRLEAPAAESSFSVDPQGFTSCFTKQEYMAWLSG